MNWLDYIISVLSPTSALRRVQARRVLAAHERAYEAAQPGKLRKQSTDRRNASAVVRSAAEKLRMQARHLDENHDLASGVLNTLVSNIIGRGIQVEPLAKNKDGTLNEEANKMLLSYWQNWCYQPEVTGDLHWSAVERLVCRSWLRDGEVFAKMLWSNTWADEDSPVPFAIELIESDYVPFGQFYPNDTAMDGIERDVWGRATKYWMSKRNNTDVTPHNDYTFAKARDIVHLKLSNRIRQNRGVSIFASVLTRLEDIKDYEESERIAAKIAASMAAYIKKGTPDLYDPPTDGESRSIQFQPGMVFDDLMQGEEIGMIDTNRPNPNLVTFREGQLKAIAAGTSTGYSSISRSYDGSYSAQRQEMVETSVHYGAMRDHFIERFSRIIWRNFVNAVISISPEELLKIKNIDLSTLNHADFRGPGLPWIDPVKEVNSAILAIKAGIKSKTYVQREYGLNPQDMHNQFVAERNQDNKSELIFSSDYVNEIKQSNQAKS